MKIWPLLVLGLMTSHPFASGAIRTFTDTEGRQIQARLLVVDRDTVLIERDDRRQFRVPIDRLSDDDKEFVERWPTLSALSNERTVEISTRRLRLNRRELRDAPGVDPALHYRRTEEELIMQILLNNRANYDLKDIHIEYRIYKDKIDPERDALPVRVVKRGQLQIKELPNLTRSQEQTMPFTLVSLDREEWGPANPVTGVYSVVRIRRSDEFVGIWVRVMEGDKVIREVTSPADLPRRVDW